MCCNCITFSILHSVLSLHFYIISSANLTAYSPPLPHYLGMYEYPIKRQGTPFSAIGYRLYNIGDAPRQNQRLGEAPLNG
jgi:hypothetical protein